MVSFLRMDPAKENIWFRRSQPSLPHFKTLPFRRQLSLLFAAFCLFSIIGFFGDLMALGQEPYAVALTYAVLSGGIATLYVIFGTRLPNYYTVLLTIGQAIFWFGFAAVLPSIARAFHLQPVETVSGIRFSAIAILTVTILSYTFFLRFIRKEGQEAIRIKNELELAHGIQKTLVPSIHIHTAGFEIYGRSDPSDKVGGDLVDALTLDDGSCVAYIADIAGHGLQAGILMGMLKTAARTTLLDTRPVQPDMVLPALMERLNRVLPGVKEPQMYATFAGFNLKPDGSVFYALAAHPPILHYQARAAREPAKQISLEQFPLGLLPVTGFSSENTTMANGDVLIAVTDGILETCNSAEEEFGLDRLQDLIAAHATDSLPMLADAILSAARAFGKQIDDQTLLFIRRL